MKILIVGGGGFIGSALLKRLPREHTCLCFGHGSRYAELRESVSGDVEFVAGDVTDVKLLREVVRAADAVIHVAGSGGEVPCLSDPVGAVLTHVQGTHLLLQEVMRQGIETVIFASTIAVYGTYRARAMPLEEEMETRPDDFYAALKDTAERMLRDAGRGQILRLANVYGYGSGLDLRASGVIGRFVEAARRGEPLQIYGDGEQAIDYVHIDDVCAAFEAALKRRGQPFVYNIGGGQPATVKSLAELTVELAADELKRRPEMVSVPAPPNKIWPDRWLSIVKAEEELGWRPRVGLRAGIQELLARTGASTKVEGR
jgi:UDP-glucose 4-epimerase